LRAFINVRDQFPESMKLIQPKLGGLTPISVTVTKDQFAEAVAALAEADLDTVQLSSGARHD
jgi:hypothetical protein